MMILMLFVDTDDDLSKANWCVDDRRRMEVEKRKMKRLNEKRSNEL